MKNTDKKTLRQRLRAKPQESEEYVRRGPNIIAKPEPDELGQPPEKPEYDGSLAPTEEQLVYNRTIAQEVASLRYPDALGGVGEAMGHLGRAASGASQAASQVLASFAGVTMRAHQDGRLSVQRDGDSREHIVADRASVASNDIAAWLGANLPIVNARVSATQNSESVDHHSIYGEHQRVVMARYTTLEVEHFAVRERSMRDAAYLAALAVPVTLFRHAGAGIARHYADETANDPHMPRGLHVFQGHQEWVLGIVGTRQIFYYNVDGGCFLRASATTENGRRNRNGGLERMIVGGYWTSI